MSWAGLAAAGMLFFWTGLRAGFVSDAFIFLERARSPLVDQLRWFVPSSEGFYRPGIEMAFWAETRLFGRNPLPFHFVQLAGHVTTALLVGLVAWRLSRSRSAAIAASVFALVSMHAHEVVFDVADLHNAIAAPLLVAAVVAALSSRPWLAAALTAGVGLLDETVLLAVPLMLLVGGIDRWSRMVSLSTIVRPALPSVAITAMYLVARLVTGGFGNEVSDSCHNAECIAAGLDQYLKRLVLRPDVVIRKDVLLWPLLIGVAGVSWLAWPMERRLRALAATGIAWALGTALFFVLALHPYIADRFLYIPSLGLGLLLAALIGSIDARRGWLRLVPTAIIVVWVAIGAATLMNRGGAWTAAGVRAAWIVQQIQARNPNPSPDTTFIVRNAPHSLRPVFPPGNTGPYVFHNGLGPALRLAYYRPDLNVVEVPPPYRPGDRHPSVRIVIYESGVVAPDEAQFTTGTKQTGR